MCQCNDIHAGQGQTGAHGHEGDGGCECAGLTVRGRHWLLFDTVERTHELRRSLSERLNFPPLLAFTPPAEPSKAWRGGAFSALSRALPPTVKLVTLTNNYADFNDGKWMLRLSHLYGAGEHPTLSQPVEVNLQEIFSAAGLRLNSAIETTLTGNRPLAEFERTKHTWRTHENDKAVADHLAKLDERAFSTRVPFAFPTVTIRPMEVRTFLADFN